jgi:diacylglycerol kinase (ATP)
MSVVTFSNPHSRSAAKHLDALQAALPASAQTTHFVTETVAELESLVKERCWERDDILVINGGDGSVQRILTLLRAEHDFALWPQIAMLPAGHTNMSAYDVNLHRQFKHCLEQLRKYAEQDQAAPLHHKQLVQVDNGRARNLGFFFGIGTIVSGIEYFHNQLRPLGGGHEVGAAVALLRTLWGILCKQPPFAEALPVTLATPVTNASDVNNIDDQILPTEMIKIRLCLVTTLQRLFLGMRPFWGTTAGPLRTTLVEERAARFLINLPRIMRGRPSLRMSAADGYHSVTEPELRINFSGPYTLDGELFNNAGELKVTASPPLRFLKL